MAAAKQQIQRTPNVQPNHLPAALAVTIQQAGTTIGLAEVPQVDNLSAAGNIWFQGVIKQGLVLEGASPEEALGNLKFEVLDTPFTQAESGVHLSAPRTRRDGTPIPNTGGNLTVTHTAVVDVPSTDGTVKPHTVMATVTHLGTDKAGNERFFSMTIKGLPRSITPRGPQVVGTFTGLQVVERA